MNNKFIFIRIIKGAICGVSTMVGLLSGPYCFRLLPISDEILIAPFFGYLVAVIPGLLVSELFGIHLIRGSAGAPAVDITFGGLVLLLCLWMIFGGLIGLVVSWRRRHLVARMWTKGFLIFLGVIGLMLFVAILSALFLGYSWDSGKEILKQVRSGTISIEEARKKCGEIRESKRDMMRSECFNEVSARSGDVLGCDPSASNFYLDCIKRAAQVHGDVLICEKFMREVVPADSPNYKNAVFNAKASYENKVTFCVMGATEGKTNAGICNKLTTPFAISECISDIAVNAKKPALCLDGRVLTDNEREQCLKHSIRFPGDVVYCQQLKSSYDRESCVSNANSTPTTRKE